ncbi:uncharacterized protein [Euphorbia lathyris]|uniref:uncharacterized protein n=1 Tax=Euphorbia lathyris TaxID=212925 RepID=UPI003313B31B
MNPYKIIGNLAKSGQLLLAAEDRSRGMERESKASETLFGEEKIKEMVGYTRGSDYVEVKCGCTSKRYGDTTATLQHFEFMPTANFFSSVIAVPPLYGLSKDLNLEPKKINFWEMNLRNHPRVEELCQ